MKQNLKSFGQHLMYTVLALVVLIPILAYANTQYRKLAIFNSTIDSTTLGATTPSTIGATTLKITSGVNRSGGGIQHMRYTSCTTSSGAGAFCGNSQNWPVAFADTNYTVTCSVMSGTLFLGAINNKTASSITPIVELTPGNSVAASTEIDCIGIHD